MSVPLVSGLSPEQRTSCERFSLLVFGEPMFDAEPSHSGRHGHTCPACSRVLSAADALAAPVPIRQPWQIAAPLAEAA